MILRYENDVFMQLIKADTHANLYPFTPPVFSLSYLTISSLALGLSAKLAANVEMSTTATRNFLIITYGVRSPTSSTLNIELVRILAVHGFKYFGTYKKQLFLYYCYINLR